MRSPHDQAREAPTRIELVCEALQASSFTVEQHNQAVSEGRAPFARQPARQSRNYEFPL